MSEPRGLRGALTWFPAGVCGGEAGPEEESDLKSPSSSLYLPAPNVAGRATGRDARRRALRPARPAPPQEPNAWVSKLPDAVTLLMRHPQPPRPRGVQIVERERAGGGAGRGAARGDRLLRQLLLRRP